MDNVFEEFVGLNAESEETGAAVEQENSDYDHSYDLGEDDFADSESSASEEKGQEEVVNEVVENPTNNAFAQMRTQNKELQEKLNELDAVAKAIGLADYNDLIAKGKEAGIKKQATEKGIPLEVARELEEMRTLKESIIAEREQDIMERKLDAFRSNIKEFVKTNNLADAAINKLSDDLEKDGISMESLMGMPKSAVNRILNSYIDGDYQRNLERKETIRKELPINQSSKINTNVLNREIDNLAKQLAGKI